MIALSPDRNRLQRAGARARQCYNVALVIIIIVTIFKLVELKSFVPSEKINQVYLIMYLKIIHGHLPGREDIRTSSCCIMGIVLSSVLEVDPCG